MINTTFAGLVPHITTEELFLTYCQTTLEPLFMWAVLFVLTYIFTHSNFFYFAKKGIEDMGMLTENTEIVFEHIVELSRALAFLGVMYMGYMLYLLYGIKTSQIVYICIMTIIAVLIGLLRMKREKLEDKL